MISDRSRAYLVQATIMVGVFLVLHALGLRDRVSVLSAAEPATNLVAATGLLYVGAWLVAVLVAPVYVVAAGIRRALVAVDRRYVGRTRS